MKRKCVSHYYNYYYYIVYVLADAKKCEKVSQSVGVPTRKKLSRSKREQERKKDENYYIDLLVQLPILGDTC